MGGCKFYGSRTRIIMGQNSQFAQSWGNSPNSSFLFLHSTEDWFLPLRCGNAVAPVVQDGLAVIPTSIMCQNIFSTKRLTSCSEEIEDKSATVQMWVFSQYRTQLPTIFFLLNSAQSKVEATSYSEDICITYRQRILDLILQVY